MNAGSGGAAGVPSGGGSAGGSGGTGGDAIDAGGAPADGSSGTSGESGSDGAPDGAPDAAVSLFCGDGIRGASEECDDGNAANDDACLTSCVVSDFLAVTPVITDASTLAPGRYLGQGRHPIGAGVDGFAVAYVEPGSGSPRVGMVAFNEKGVRLGAPIQVSGTSQGGATLFSDPVVAALPGGKYAVAWTDFGADGDALGVALRAIDPLAAPSVLPTHANVTTGFSQYDPDLLWTGAELVVAWADDSELATSPDLRVRTFDAALKEKTAEQKLANSDAAEGAVALAPTQAGWAAAWRAASPDGSESLGAKSGAVSWSVGPHPAAPSDDKPALAELDATTFLVVFTIGDAGAGSGSKLRGALLDSTAPGSATAFSLEPSPGDAGLSGGAQSHPNVIRVGTRLYLAWRAAAEPGKPLAEELWLRELAWAGGVLTLLEPLRLPRSMAHTFGDQRFPALATSPLGPEGALAAAWVDFGLVFGAGQGAPDVVVELIPTPILRKNLIDGGGG